MQRPDGRRLAHRCVNSEKRSLLAPHGMQTAYDLLYYQSSSRMTTRMNQMTHAGRVTFRYYIWDHDDRE